MVNKLKTCRCCLAEFKDESELYEFSSEVSVDSEELPTESQFIRIAEVYSQITSIEVDGQAQDSSKICPQCLGDLKFSFIFQRRCLESEKQYLSQAVEGEQQILLWVWKLVILCFVSELNIIEYVEEEYIDDMHDENTHDGYETEDVDVKQEVEDKPEVKVEVPRKSWNSTLKLSICATVCS